MKIKTSPEFYLDSFWKQFSSLQHLKLSQFD